MRAATVKISMFALAVCLLPAKAHAVGYSITIPGVASYPVTTITFSSKSMLAGSQAISPSSIRVTFNSANWSASVRGGRWVTNGAGTYFSFACDRSSAPCMRATRGSGSYSYTLVGPTATAPSSKGEFHLNWDVNPPGDIAYDVTNVPEPSTLLLLGTGLLGLLGAMRRKLG